jgi:hypothetical protein
MYLVQVDDGLPEVVLLLVEVTHTNLTKVTRVVLIESVSIHRSVHRIWPIFASRESVEPCPSWCGGGADHRPYHDHRDACGACRHGRVRGRRGRDYTEKNLVSMRSYRQEDAKAGHRCRYSRLEKILQSSNCEIQHSKTESRHIQLAGLRSTGRHGDGWLCCRFPVDASRTGSGW